MHAPDTDAPGAVLLRNSMLLLSAPSRRDRRPTHGGASPTMVVLRHLANKSMNASVPVQLREIGQSQLQLPGHTCCSTASLCYSSPICCCYLCCCC
jgi:hypothetical protein